jgi:UDP:flavonoid glycosyltransferase YjiC (YdhE family)
MLSKKEWLVLYKCEGDKTHPRSVYSVAVTNSDPKILQWFVDGLEAYYNTKRKQLHFSLKLWKGMPEASEKEYWAQLLRIAVDRYWGTTWVEKGKTFDPSKHGICKARLHSKALQLQILKDIASLE